MVKAILSIVIGMTNARGDKFSVHLSSNVATSIAKHNVLKGKHLVAHMCWKLAFVKTIPIGTFNRRSPSILLGNASGSHPVTKTWARLSEENTARGTKPLIVIYFGKVVHRRTDVVLQSGFCISSRFNYFSTFSREVSIWTSLFCILVVRAIFLVISI